MSGLAVLQSGSILPLSDVVQTAAGNCSLKLGLAMGWCSINSVVMLPTGVGSGRWAGVGAGPVVASPWAGLATGSLD